MPKHRYNRVFVLGIDGMDPGITTTLLKSGALPHFKRLAERGHFSELETINPPQSPAVWATMATGRLPYAHGVSDFIMRQGKTYTPDLSLVKRNEGNVLGNPKKAFLPSVDPKLFFWEELRRSDVDAIVLRWPMTFPATGEARVLAGLGAPDLHGGMGRYTIFTDRQDMVDRDVKGDVVLTSLMEGEASLVVKGPLKSSLGRTRSSEAFFAVKKVDECTVELTFGDETLRLSEGELSPWVSLTFPLGLGVRTRGIVRFLPLQVKDSFTLYMSPIQMDPSSPLYPISTPPHLAQELAEKLGVFHTIGMAEDTNALRDEIISENHFLDLCHKVMEQAEEIMWQGYKEFHRGFFGFVFDTTDRIQHMFWRYRDAQHPLHGHHNQELFSEVIHDYYKRMDVILGKVLEDIDDRRDLLMVVSDHGFTHYRTSIHVNRWLIEQGYMVLKDGETDDPGLYRNVDWSKTRAFALGFSQIFLNIKGRDEQGIVDAERVDSLKAEIAAKLQTLEDPTTGNSVIRNVYDASVAFAGTLPNGPELVVGTNSGYRFSWQTALGAAPKEVMEPNDNKWSGDHCVDASCVPGVIFSNQGLTDQPASVLDIAPTVLEALQVKPRKELPGRSLL